MCLCIRLILCLLGPAARAKERPAGTDQNRHTETLRWLVGAPCTANSRGSVAGVTELSSKFVRHARKALARSSRRAPIEWHGETQRVPKPELGASHQIHQHRFQGLAISRLEAEEPMAPYPARDRSWGCAASSWACTAANRAARACSRAVVNACAVEAPHAVRNGHSMRPQCTYLRDRAVRICSTPGWLPYFWRVMGSRL
jgi:hypothetical protein